MLFNIIGMGSQNCGFEAVAQDDIGNVLSFLFGLFGREQSVALFSRNYNANSSTLDSWRAVISACQPGDADFSSLPYRYGTGFHGYYASTSSLLICFSYAWRTSPSTYGSFSGSLRPISTSPLPQRPRFVTSLASP